MADGASYTAVIRPELEEMVRVLTPVTMRRRDMASYRLVCALFGIAMFGVAVLFIVERHTDFILVGLFVILSLMFMLLPPIAVRNMVRKSIRTQLETTTDYGTITFSDGGIDTKTENSSAHVNWAIVRTVRRIPEGMLVDTGRATSYVAARYFATLSDFESAVAIAREALGAKFVG